jgi:hypothetical protein
LDQVEVSSYWGDAVGTIDSQFRYQVPKSLIPNARTFIVFHIVRTDKHIVIAGTGEQRVEATGTKEWKLKGPLGRWATVEKAITYLTDKRGQVTNVELRENIDRTLATLRRLSKSHNDACAC